MDSTSQQLPAGGIPPPQSNGTPSISAGKLPSTTTSTVNTPPNPPPQMKSPSTTARSVSGASKLKNASAKPTSFS